LMREAVVNQEVRITPERFTKLYLDRVENLRDWCLSRQLWWGHRIPAWYHEGKCIPKSGHEGEEARCEEIIVSVEKPTCEHCDAEYTQDPDTLDTWFSSGSWTFSTLGWPDKTEDLKTFHPTSFMQMGYEILYLWMMRMILMSEYALEEVPFKDVYIHGIVRDEEGKKFSKSAGNGIDPIEVIEKYGCDALRYHVMIGTSPGNDSRFSLEKLESARNLVNKIWNMSRYILTVILSETKDLPPKEILHSVQNDSKRTLADDWILSRLADVTASVTDKLEHFQFSSAGEELRDFTWSDLADWYLEIAKVEGGKTEILKTLLNAILRLWHPFMPFVTEHIWKLAGYEGDLIVAEWPEPTSPLAPLLRKERGTEAIAQLRLLVTDMRRLRAEQGVEAAKKIAFSLVAEEETAGLVGDNIEWIKRLANASSIDLVDNMLAEFVVTTSGTSTIGIDKAGAVDLAAERTRLEKELKGLEVYIAATEVKLTDAEFSKKAPDIVVRNMSDKLQEAKDKVTVIKSRLQ